MALGRARERRVEGWGVEVWGGRKRRREEDLVRVFLFLLFDLTDCHTQSTPSLSLHPYLAESLCFYGNRLPCLPDNAPHQHPHSPLPTPLPQSPMQWLLRCRSDTGSLGRRGEDVTWMEETERAKRWRMEGEERAKRKRGRSREMEEGGLRKTDGGRKRNPGIDKDERWWRAADEGNIVGGREGKGKGKKELEVGKWGKGRLNVVHTKCRNKYRQEKSQRDRRVRRVAAEIKIEIGVKGARKGGQAEKNDFQKLSTSPLLTFVALIWSACLSVVWKGPKCSI